MWKNKAITGRKDLWYLMDVNLDAKCRNYSENGHNHSFQNFSINAGIRISCVILAETYPVEIIAEIHKSRIAHSGFYSRVVGPVFHFRKFFIFPALYHRKGKPGSHSVGVAHSYPGDPHDPAGQGSCPGSQDHGP